MRQSDVGRQIQRLLDSQCVYRLQWSRLAVLRMMQGLDPLVRYRAPKVVRPDDRDYAPDSIQAEALRQAEADKIQSALSALRAALQAGSARQAELQRQTVETAGNTLLPYGSALSAMDRASASVLCKRNAGHTQSRQTAGRAGRSRGIEARSMVPASDIARLTTPRSTDVQSSSVFFRSTAGQDYSLSHAMREAGTLDNTACQTYRDGVRRLGLRPAPRQALWTKRQASAGESERGKPVSTDCDDMAEQSRPDGRHGRQARQARQAERHGSKIAQVASAECLAALEARQAARRK